MIMPLGVKFKISDKHPRLFHMEVRPGIASKVKVTFGQATMGKSEILVMNRVGSFGNWAGHPHPIFLDSSLGK